ncbi:MAG TPA: TIGR02588 family protein [Leptolyngbyaceae cyanobacterium M65_K2018_010]|nr:TIGR02588 family protein [Leptolyngbyaceae cyanobacterium M65_K2018_010]
MTISNSPSDSPQTPSPQPSGSFTQRSLAEWVTFGVASLILIGLMSLNQNRPPAFDVAVSDAIRITDGRYYVPFAITNTGGRIANGVQVTAELHTPGEDDETGEQQIDFLSGHETKAGSFVFNHNPEVGDLIVRVASYRIP